jgi:hypothetical protein
VRRLALLAALALPLSACSSAETRSENRSIRKGAISVGMTMEDVSTVWGPPTNIVRATSDIGEDVQWVYADGRSVDFNEGVVKSFEDPGAPPK